MREQLTASILVMAIVAFAAAPCAAMTAAVDDGAMAAHCDEHGGGNGAPTSPIDCCTVSQAPAWQMPSTRVQSEAPTTVPAPVPLAVHVWPAEEESPADWLTCLARPRPPDVARHLLLSVFLI